MPEGPQVRRTGNLIAKFTGATITGIQGPKSRDPWQLRLPVTITKVDVYGKNIFIRLSNRKTVYNHMLMWGSWRSGCDDSYGKKRLNTCFSTSQGALGYYGGGVLRLVSGAEATALKRRVGPDLMQAPSAAIAFKNVGQADVPIGEAVLMQELVAGIGNIYKSEGLFAAKVHPLRPAANVTNEEFAKMFAFLQPQMRGDVKKTGPIMTTTLATRKAGTRNFVYRRWHQPCLFCGTKVERIYQGQRWQRSTYFCPHCQPLKT